MTREVAMFSPHSEANPKLALAAAELAVREAALNLEDARLKSERAQHELMHAREVAARFIAEVGE